MFFKRELGENISALIAICIFIIGLSVSFLSLNREFNEVTIKYERFEKKLEKQYIPVIRSENRLLGQAGQRKLHSLQIPDQPSPRIPRIRRALPDAINFDQFNIFMQMGVAQKAARKKEIDLIKGVELLEDNL